MEELNNTEYINIANRINNNIEFLKNNTFCKICNKFILRNKKFYCSDCKNEIEKEKNKIIKCELCNVIYKNKNKLIHEKSQFHKNIFKMTIFN